MRSVPAVDRQDNAVLVRPSPYCANAVRLLMGAFLCPKIALFAAQDLRPPVVVLAVIKTALPARADCRSHFSGGSTVQESTHAKSFQQCETKQTAKFEAVGATV
jgi:hypothetical protein